MKRNARIKSRSAANEMRLREQRQSFSDMLDHFRELQEIYMPGAARALNALDDKQRSLSAEDTKLFLPSDLCKRDRVSGCAARIVDIAGRFRSARCSDAIALVRQHLHNKQYLIAFRNANVTGQKDSTRARSFIDRVGERVETAAEKYRKSRQALVNLEHPDVTKFPELNASDLTLDQEVDPDLLAVVKLGNANTNARPKTHVSTGKRTLSWIWTADGGPKDDESFQDECTYSNSYFLACN